MLEMNRIEPLDIEKEMIKMVEENIYTEILNEIIREVSFFEMWILSFK